MSSFSWWICLHVYQHRSLLWFSAYGSFSAAEMFAEKLFSMEGHHLHHHHRQQQQQHHHQQQHQQQQHHHHPHHNITTSNVDATDRFPQWSIQETKEFLMIRAELDQTFMDTKRNKQLWEVISTRMKEKGFHKSAEQCKCKWKNLVTRYKVLFL